MTSRVIIPISNVGGPEFSFRLRNLKNLIKSIPLNIPITLVEQSVGNLSLYIYNIQNQSNLTKISVSFPVYNKCWLLNIGAVQSSEKYLLFIDADIQLPDSFFNVVTNTGINDWCYLWSSLQYLNEHGSVVQIRNPRPGVSEGIVGYSREFFLKIGMWNEWMQELGGEDNEMCCRARFLSEKNNMIPILLTHAFHPLNSLNKAYKIGRQFRTPIYNSNIQILEWCRRNTGKMIQILIENGNGLGQISSPICSKKDLILGIEEIL